MAYRKTCTFPTIHAAAIGSPMGLTKIAITAKIRAFCTEPESSTSRDRILTKVPASPKTNAEQ